MDAWGLGVVILESLLDCLPKMTMRYRKGQAWCEHIVGSVRKLIEIMLHNMLQLDPKNKPSAEACIEKGKLLRLRVREMEDSAQSTDKEAEIYPSLVECSRDADSANEDSDAAKKDSTASLASPETPKTSNKEPRTAPCEQGNSHQAKQSPANEPMQHSESCRKSGERATAELANTDLIRAESWELGLAGFIE